MLEPIRVLVVGSSRSSVSKLAAMLGEYPNITVVARSVDVFAAAAKADELNPQVILLDMPPDEAGGLKTISVISQRLPAARVVVLSDSEESDDIFRALSYGADGYLLKGTSDAEIAHALEKAASGDVVVSPSLATKLVQWLREKAREPKLSQREAEVLTLLGKGLKNREIASHLVVSESTARTYIYRLQDKLGFKSRLELSIYANRHHSRSASIPEMVKPPALGLIGVPSKQADIVAAAPYQVSDTPETRHATGTTPWAELKLATALFVKLVFSGLGKKVAEANAIEEISTECLDVVAKEVELHGGVVAWFTSLGVMSLFGVPVSDEQSPQRALYAALSIEEHVKGLSRQLRSRGVHANARIAINTGVVLVQKDTKGMPKVFKPVGNTTELATKALDMADASTIVVTESTYKLTRNEFVFEPLGGIKVDEEEESTKVYRLTELRVSGRKPEGVALRRLTRFVGRQREIDALDKAFSRVRAGSGQVVGIVSEAGMGKSRLLLEFTRRLPSGKFIYLEGSCRSYGSSDPYLPIVQILQ